MCNISAISYSASNQKKSPLFASVVSIWLFLLWASVAHAATPISPSESSQFTLTQEEKLWLAEHPEVHMGMMGAWPPFNFVDMQGMPTGIGVDYVAALNKRLNGVLKLVPGSWKNIYEEVKEKRLDALLDITPNKSGKNILISHSPT